MTGDTETLDWVRIDTVALPMLVGLLLMVRRRVVMHPECAVVAVGRSGL